MTTEATSVCKNSLDYVPDRTVLTHSDDNPNATLCSQRNSSHSACVVQRYRVKFGQEKERDLNNVFDKCALLSIETVNNAYDYVEEPDHICTRCT